MQGYILGIPHCQTNGIAHVYAFALGEPCDAWHHPQNAPAPPLLDEFLLNRKARPWTDQADLVAENVPDLGEFVDLRTAQELSQTVCNSHRGDVMSAGLDGSDLHRPEFVAGEYLPVATDAVLPENAWPF